MFRKSSDSKAKTSFSSHVQAGTFEEDFFPLLIAPRLMVVPRQWKRAHQSRAELCPVLRQQKTRHVKKFKAHVIVMEQGRPNKKRIPVHSVRFMERSMVESLKFHLLLSIVQLVFLGDPIA